MVTLLAAIAFILLTAIVIVFQLALIAGAPWGELTLGGRFPGRLPAKMRLVPVLSALLLAGFAAVIAATSGADRITCDVVLGNPGMGRGCLLQPRSRRQRCHSKQG